MVAREVAWRAWLAIALSELALDPETSHAADKKTFVIVRCALNFLANQYVLQAECDVLRLVAPELYMQRCGRRQYRRQGFLCLQSPGFLEQT